MLVTADAHHCSELTRDFERGTRMLREAGYQESAVFTRPKMRMVGLNESPRGSGGYEAS